MNGLLPTYLVSPLTTALWWNITGRVKILKDDLEVVEQSRVLADYIVSYLTVLTKRYSACSNSQVHAESDQGFNRIRNYRICNMHLWESVQVLENDSGNGEVKFSLLSPNGPSRWYHYPPIPNIFLARITDILTVVEPRTTMHRLFLLPRPK